MTNFRLPFRDPQPLDQEFKTVRPWRFCIDVKSNDREEFLAQVRLYLPEFVAAEKAVQRLKKQNKALREKLSKNGTK